jgi:hypothetical protein
MHLRRRVYLYKLMTATDESKLINFLGKYIVNHSLILFIYSATLQQLDA